MKAKRMRATKKIVIIMSFAILLGLTQVLGVNYSYFGSATAEMSWWNLALKIVLYIFILGAGLYALFFFFDKMLKNNYDLPKKMQFLKITWSKKNIILCAIIIFAFWSIYLIILYPGLMSRDTYWQLFQYYHMGPLSEMGGPDAHDIFTFSDHHPIFDTFVFGGFVQFGELVLGQQNYGVFLYVVIQTVCTALACGAMVCYMDKLGSPYWFRLICLFFFSLFPVFAFYSATMLKDSFFCWVYLVYILFMVEAGRTKGEVFHSKLYLAGLLADIFLMCLTKKTGYYLVLTVGILYLLFFIRKNRIKFVLSNLILPFVLMSVILPVLIFPALNVEPSGKQEAFGTLFQQTARYVKFYESEVTPEEKEVIDKVLDYENLAENYSSGITDKVKFTYKVSAASEDMKRYLGVWAAQGLKHPKVYFDSLFSVCGDYFSVGWEMTIYHKTGKVLAEKLDKIEAPESLVPIKEKLFSYFEWIEEAFLTKIFFRNGLYIWWIPVFSILCMILKKNKKNICLLLPMLVPILLLMIVPIAVTRYALPQIYAAPLVLSIALWNWNKTEAEQKQQHVEVPG